MKTYGVVAVQIRVFLTSSLVRGKESASRPGRFTPGERTRRTNWIEGLVGPKAGLDNVEKRKFLTLLGLELRPLGHSGRSQSLYRLRYSASLWVPKQKRESGVYFDQMGISYQLFKIRHSPLIVIGISNMPMSDGR
jgi:hypothetical protein